VFHKFCREMSHRFLDVYLATVSVILKLEESLNSSPQIGEVLLIETGCFPLVQSLVVFLNYFW
jgi:hypothetical protein